MRREVRLFETMRGAFAIADLDARYHRCVRHRVVEQQTKLVNQLDRARKQSGVIETRPAIPGLS